MIEVGFGIFWVGIVPICMSAPRGRVAVGIRYLLVGCAALHPPYGSAFHTNLDLGTTGAAIAGRINLTEVIGGFHVIGCATLA
jgi:hypothetical protein